VPYAYLPNMVAFAARGAGCSISSSPKKRLLSDFDAPG
jgi:hypothetical protein